MKKLFAMLLCSAMLFSLISCGNSNNGGGAMNNVSTNTSSDDDLPTITWKMASVWGEGNFHHDREKDFTKLVAELTNGKFIITNYGAGELCEGSQTFDYVADGTVECAGDCPAYWVGRDVAFELGNSTMNDFSSLDYVSWIYQGDGLEALQDLYGQYGIRYYPITCTWAESGFRTSKPCTSLADMSTMKLRCGSVLPGRVLAKFGVNVVSMSTTEVYESIMRGVIDGAEFSTPSADDSLGIQEVAPYWLLPCWYQSACINGLMVNPDAYEALPDEYKQALYDAARYNAAWTSSYYFYNDALTTNQMLDEQGVTTTYLSQADQDALAQAIEEVYAEAANESENFRKIRESMLAYRETVDPYREILGEYGFGKLAEE